MSEMAGHDDGLPHRAPEDTDLGWSESLDDDDDLQRHLSERPPHHEG